MLPLISSKNTVKKLSLSNIIQNQFRDKIRREILPAEVFLLLLLAKDSVVVGVDVVLSGARVLVVGVALLLVKVLHLLHTQCPYSIMGTDLGLRAVLLSITIYARTFARGRL
jgi:hypothetical protein